MDVLITDVTEMQKGNYCVAGWNAAGMRMIRPLPNGGNWTAALLEQQEIVPGITVRFVRSGKANGAFPHRTEDTPIDVLVTTVVGRAFSNWLGASAPPVAASLDAGFDGHLVWNREWNQTRQGVYVRAGTECKSLIAIRVGRTDISFSEGFGKLKTILHDGTARYSLAVSSRVLKEAWRQGGLLAARNALPHRTAYCVRVGLARPFGDRPNECYLMVNGVL
jgi:hypothetical protein